MLPFDLGFTGVGRGRRDARTEAVASGYWKSVLEQQTQTPYAGDDDDPRALPTRTLSWMRERLQDMLDAQDHDGTQVPPLGLHIAFRAEDVAMSAAEVIPVPREHLWWLAAPGDLLLLSDGVTTHFMTLLHANAENERAALVDEWPERVFLQEGLNEAEVAARVQPFFAGVFDFVLPGRQEVEISRAEFERVVVGLVTYDTPAVLDRLEEHAPERYAGAAEQLAFGLALMAPAHDALARFAAPHCLRAEAVARAQGRADLARRAAAWSYAAHSIASLKLKAGAALHATAPLDESLKALHLRYTEAALFAELDVEMLIRIGNVAAHAAEYDAAFAWLSKAIERDPFHDAAHWLRAKVCQMRNEPQAQVADASEALRRNQAFIDRRRAEYDARDPRDHAAQRDDLGRIAGLLTRRVEELTIRAGGYARLGQLQAAEHDLVEAARIKPDDPALQARLAALRSLLPGDRHAG